MFSVRSALLILLHLSLSYSNSLPELSTDTTNAYLRSFLPWWPKNDDFSLRMAPTPLDVQDFKNETTNAPDVLNPFLNETEELDPSMLKVHDVPASPLDEIQSNSHQENVAPRSSQHHDGNFIINFDEMGECPRDCSNDLREALGFVLQDMSHVERYHRICEKYQNASVCVSEDVRCDKDDRGMFEMMTSGLNYMCVEQQLAFNATIKCIDDEAGLVQSECDAQCQTKNLFLNWMMRGAMQDTIQQGVSGIVGAATGANPNALAPAGWADMLANIGQRPPNPQAAQQGFENFRQFTNDLCRIGDCMLDCIRSKFNTRCEGSAGTLLSEVFVRPIAVSQNKLSMLRPVLGVFMPEQCAYLTNNADLKKHRIDSTMDEELKRMYAEKMAKEIRDKVAEDELLSNLVPLDKNGVPLPRALPDLTPIDSPLDVSVETLDQLILDMYSKNESEASNISEKNNVTATFLDEESYEKEDNNGQTTKSVNETSVVPTTTTLNQMDDETKEGSGVEKSTGDSNSGSEPSSDSIKTPSTEGSGVVESSELAEESSGSAAKNETSDEYNEFSGPSEEEQFSGSGKDISLENEELVASGDGSGEDVLLVSTNESSDTVSTSSTLLVESSGEGSGEGSGIDEFSLAMNEGSGTARDFDRHSSGEEAPSLVTSSDNTTVY